ncbi:hypothetical protein Scep_010644 [Stephania cephalantha]|uniref:RRM domain-containing protein n=1 Tax=Stephania cephalantha TaxID=152367 RepID=A0AAP0PDH5_9MAGN
MTALAATTTMGTLSQVPMAPSAAAMAAAQAIVAAQALQAHAAQMQAQAQSAKTSSGSLDNSGKVDVLKKTLQVSNLSPLLTAEQLKQLFSYCGTVVECSITDSKHFAFIEYSKPEEATAALALNNMDVGGRPLNVEMAKSLPPKPAILNSPVNQSSLPMVMQQAVAMQQMQFQQALLMQQTLTSQQAANRAATMKSATELASARAAEISRKLKAEGIGNEENETDTKTRSPSLPRQKSKSRSRSPIKYRHSRRSRSFSPPMRRTRGRRSRSPLRSHHHKNYESERWYHRDISDRNNRDRRRERDRFRDHYSSSSRRRSRSRSLSPRTRKSSKARSPSPKRRRESLSPRARKESRGNSRSPRHHRGSRPSPKRNHDNTSYHRRHSRSKSPEGASYRRRRSRSKSVEDKSNHRRRSRSGSVEGRVHSAGKRDRSKSDRLKIDERNQKNDGDVEKQQVGLENANVEGVDVLDSSALFQKSAVSQDDKYDLEDQKDEIKIKKYAMGGNESLKFETLASNGSHPENNLSNLSEDKKLAARPFDSKGGSTSVDGQPPSRSKDGRKSDKRSDDRRHKSDTKTERNDSAKDRAHIVYQNISRHGKSSSEHKRHEKVESFRREKGVLDNDSRECRRATDYSESKSHWYSSKNSEDVRGGRDRYRSEKKKHEISIIAEDDASGESDLPESKDRVARYPISKSLRSSSPVEDGTKDSPYRRSKVDSKKFDNIRDQDDDADAEILAEDKGANVEKSKIYDATAALEAQENLLARETSIHRTSGVENHEVHENSVSEEKSSEWSQNERHLVRSLDSNMVGERQKRSSASPVLGYNSEAPMISEQQNLPKPKLYYGSINDLGDLSAGYDTERGLYDDNGDEMEE